MNTLLKYLKALSGMKNYLSFLLCLTSILGFMALAWWKSVDIGSVIPIIIGLYISGRTTQKVMAVKSASADPNCDTAQVIRELHGIKPDSPE